MKLESALTVFTAIALMASSADAFAPDSFRFVTVATGDDDSYHIVKTTNPPLSHDQKLSLFISQWLISRVQDNKVQYPFIVLNSGLLYIAINAHFSETAGRDLMVDLSSLRYGNYRRLLSLL